MSQVMRYAFFVSLLLIFQSTWAQSPKNKVDSIIHLITPSTYRQHFDSIHTLPEMSRKVMEGNVQSSDHDACRDYILRSLIRYLGNENVTLQPFEQDNNQGLANVIGIKPGTNPDKGFIIVSAHYDSNNNREENEATCSPGANDNGTGIAAILEIARVLSEFKTESTIIFAAWDLEEQYTNGYATGSNRWYNNCTYRKKSSKQKNKNVENKIARDKITANINFDMFGNPCDTIEGKPVLWACSGNIKHRKFVNEYVNTLNQYVPEIKVINKGLMPYSDHFTFGARRIPAVENLESDYERDPFFHTCSDNLENPENINIEFATNVTRGGLAFLIIQLLEL